MSTYYAGKFYVVLFNKISEKTGLINWWVLLTDVHCIQNICSALNTQVHVQYNRIVDSA